MKTLRYYFLFLVIGLAAIRTDAQSSLFDTPIARKENKIVAITGVRFAYPLVQKWIDDYNKINPEVQIIIESRGSSDPAKYDILIEAYEPDEELKKTRNYSYIGRYVILPVANSHAAFSKVYGSKGLSRDLIKQLFFHDIFADKKEQTTIKEPYTVYTRLQKAGAPITFSKHFGYQQKDIRGKSIAGADEHLLKALLRDSVGLSYLPMNLLFDQQTGKPIQGITILPVDLNGNGKISDDEKFYSDLPAVIQHLEEKNQKDINNVPIEYLNFSVDKNGSSPEAIAFLQWVIQNGEHDLHAFGFLKPERIKPN
jgi:phosphate transport system substrate-binding protein